MTRRRFAILVFLLALALRLAPVLIWRDLPIGLDDMFQYDMLARSVVAGEGYRWYAEEDLALIERHISMERPPAYDPRGVPTSFRAPGYPAFLALVYAACGVGRHRFFAARLAQALLGAALAPLTWALAQQVSLRERTARWAAIFIATFPLLVVYPLALASENLFVPLLTLALVLTLRSRSGRALRFRSGRALRPRSGRALRPRTSRPRFPRPRPGQAGQALQAGEGGRARDHALAGLAFGLAALTRSIVTAFVPLAAMWVGWTAGKRRTGWRNGVLLVLCFVLVTGPWAVRNTLLHGQPTWIETSLGYNLYLGYHPQSTGTFEYGISLDLLPILDDAERDARGVEAFWHFVRADPGRVPTLMARKAGYLWGLDSRALIYFYANGFLGRWPGWLLGLVLLLTCGPLVLMAPAAAAGLACGRMERRKGLVGLLVTCYTGLHMLIMAEPRFHVPLLPVVAVLAAYALTERPCRRSCRWQWALAAALIGLLFLNWGLELARDWDTLVALFGPDGHRLRLSY